MDAQFWFRSAQDEHREDDGIHWNALSHRWLTNIFLSHISAAWGHGWPKYPVKDQVEEKPENFENLTMNTLRDVQTEFLQTTATPAAK